MIDLVTSGSLLFAIPIALVAGLISFVSSCLLSLALGYVSYVSGLTAVQISDTSTVTSCTELRRRRGVILAGSAFFVAGFTAVFVSYGALFGGLGARLLMYQDPITRVLGVVVIALGIAYLVELPLLNREWRSERRPARGLWGAPFLGVVFGLGWAPCIGPVLAVVQTLAFTQASAARGALLSVVYCIGLGIPFLVIGLAFDKAITSIGWARRHTPVLMKVSGALMIAVGVLLVSGAWTDVTIWMRVQSGSFQPPL
jgi:cytochrome c-type biogenesis protein